MDNTKPTESVDLDRLEQLARAATPGPWSWWTSNSMLRLTGADGQDGGVLCPYYASGHADLECSAANQAFMAAANPATLLALIALARRAPAQQGMLEALYASIAALPSQDRYGCAYVLRDSVLSEIVELQEQAPAQQEADAMRNALQALVDASDAHDAADDDRDFGQFVTIGMIENARAALTQPVGQPAPGAGQGPVPFRLGNEYQTQAGEWVRFVKVHNEGTCYETMEDQHGHNRYTRRDFGRCTGTAHDYSYPGNTPPLYAAPVSAPGDERATDMLRDMLAIQEACGLHTDEYAPGSVIEYIKELEAESTPAAQAVEPAGQRAVGELPACRMQGGICACRSGGSFGGCARERSDCCTNEPAAQPSAGQAAAGPVELLRELADAADVVLGGGEAKLGPAINKARAYLADPACAARVTRGSPQLISRIGYALLVMSKKTISDENRRDVSATLHLCEDAISAAPTVAAAGPVASIPTWQKRLNAVDPSLRMKTKEQAMKAEIAELRAKLFAGYADAALTQAARDVLAERRRQVEAEGWTPEHDDHYDENQLSRAAACYATQGHLSFPEGWPWTMEWWKPRDRRRNLIKSGALILAEIERLDRAAMASPVGAGETGGAA